MKIDPLQVQFTKKLRDNEEKSFLNDNHHIKNMTTILAFSN